MLKKDKQSLVKRVTDLETAMDQQVNKIKVNRQCTYIICSSSKIILNSNNTSIDVSNIGGKIDCLLAVSTCNSFKGLNQAVSNIVRQLYLMSVCCCIHDLL